MVDFNQLHQSGFIAIAFDDKAALALIVNMFVVQIGELNEGLVRLFKPASALVALQVTVLLSPSIMSAPSVNVAALPGVRATCSPSPILYQPLLALLLSDAVTETVFWKSPPLGLKETLAAATVLTGAEIFLALVPPSYSK